jgi:hypothetical protein
VPIKVFKNFGKMSHLVMILTKYYRISYAERTKTVAPIAISSLMPSNPFTGIKCINIQKSIKVRENMIRYLALEVQYFHFFCRLFVNWLWFE